MRRLRPPGAALGIAACVAAGVVPGRAAAEPEQPAITYSAPAGCPAEREFLAAVDARRSGFAPAGERERRTFDVRVDREGPAGASFRGTLRVQDGGDVRERLVTEPTCGEVVRVLSVLTALALDVESDEATPAPTAPPVATVVPPAVRAMPDVPPDVPPDTTPLLPSSLQGRMVDPRIRVGASLGLRSDLATSAGETLAIDVGRDRPNGWSPALRIGALNASTWEGLARVGALVYTVAAVRAGYLDLCPLRYDAIGLYVSGCLRGELGVFDASVRSYAAWAGVSSSRTLQWASVGPTGGVRGDLGRLFFLEAEAGLSLPLTRTRIDDAGGGTLYATPSAAAWVGFGLGVYLVSIKTTRGGH